MNHSRVHGSVPRILVAFLPGDFHRPCDLSNPNP
jgi:hypothetical protein